MAATELLDYNQVQEQSPATGDTIPSTGGPIIWQFRADPNLAWDPSQSFFAMDVTIENYGTPIVPLVLVRLGVHVRLGPLLLPTTSLVVRTCGPFSLCAASMALAT